MKTFLGSNSHNIDSQTLSKAAFWGDNNRIHTIIIIVTTSPQIPFLVTMPFIRAWHVKEDHR